MIAVDTNLLVCAHRSDADSHERAATKVRELAEGRAAWAIPWPCIHEFIGIATHPRIWSPPTPLEQAIEQVESWLGSPSLVVLSEGSDHWSELRRLLETGRVTGPRVHDARIAALCIANGVRVLWSADRDFGRFPALTTTNPLVE